MTSSPAYYSLDIPLGESSDRRSRTVTGFLASGAACVGMLCFLVAPSPAPTRLFSLPKLQSGVALGLSAGKSDHSGWEDDDKRVGGEWPPHYVAPTKLAHPHQDSHTTTHEDLDAEVAEEGIGGEWPAHYVAPRKLAHPVAHASHPTSEPMGLDMEVAEEWPAHHMEPRKLAHPVAHASHPISEPMGLDMEVAEEGIGGEWPAHHVAPRKLAHPVAHGTKTSIP